MLPARCVSCFPPLAHKRGCWQIASRLRGVAGSVAVTTTTVAAIKAGVIVAAISEVLGFVFGTIEQAGAAPGAALAAAGGSAADIVEAGLAGEIAAAGAARPRTSGSVRCTRAEAAAATVVSHHRADAVEHHRAADDASRRRCRSAEEGAARSRWLHQDRKSVV